MKSHIDLSPPRGTQMTLREARWRILQRCQTAIISALKGYSIPHKLSQCELYLQCTGSPAELTFRTASEPHVLHLTVDLPQAKGTLNTDSGPPCSFALLPEACQLYPKVDGRFKFDLAQQVNLTIALAHRQAQ